MRQSYQQQGFLVLEDFVNKPMIDTLRNRAYSLASEIGRGLHPIINPQCKRAWRMDDLESTTRSYCCYWEDSENPSSRLLKVSHALHKLDPCFQSFSESSGIMQLANELGLARPKIIQSMLHFKPSSSSSAVDWHQDATYIATSPCSTLGLWIALEDSTLDNGCLRVIPEAHHQGPCSQMIRSSSGELSFNTLQEKIWPLESAIALPVPAGTLIALHGCLPHRSNDNFSQHSRLSLTFHLVDLITTYSHHNWLPLELT